jgi:shikimate kinase / 3-dehydroquinate synthase
VIVLVGFMGAGKTTVGRLLADALGTGFVDADDEIERRAGVTVADVFSTRGEEAFRSLEGEVIAELLSRRPGVIALGGGALGLPDTRRRLELAESATVVYLGVDHEAALARVGEDSGRPMLRLADARTLHTGRLRTYEQVAAVSIDTTYRKPDEVVSAIVDWLHAPAHDVRARRVEVRVEPRPYAVIAGAGAATRIASLVPDLSLAERAFVITHPELLSIGEMVAESFRSAGLRTAVLDIPPGESSKSLDTAGLLYDRLGKEAAHRNDLVVGVGGGVVTDVAGFVASTFNRGMPLVHVPTTLLGQVDAAIGGKTGINLEHGKNLVGTFYQPRLVVCDVELLSTLPVEEIRAGLAEVIKYGFIAAPDLLEVTEKNATQILAADPELLGEIVGRSAEIKASIVAEDEREEGRRALLNYGHTFAHAIERSAGWGGIRHGEAVAVGMMAAAHLGRALGRFDQSVVEMHRRVLGAVGLPVTASLEIDALERAWLRDKKYLHGVRFVLLKAIGEAESGVTAPRAAIVKALEGLSK